MRHRKVQNLDMRMEAAAGWLVADAAANKGSWRRYFAELSAQAGSTPPSESPNDKKLYMELG